MTDYFVTEPTTLLGTRIIGGLLQRPDCTTVYALVPPGALGAKLQWPDESRVVPVAGELDEPGIGEGLPGSVDHVVHLSTRGIANVLAFAEKARAVAVHQFTREPGDAAVLHSRSAIHFREYRPSVMLGDSGTGQPAGEGAALGLISRLARLPRRMPLIAPDMGHAAVVLVDYVAAAMIHLMHQDAPSGIVYHLAGPEVLPVREIYNAFAKAAGAPRIIATAPRAVSRPLAVLADAAMRVAVGGPRSRAVWQGCGPSWICRGRCCRAGNTWTPQTLWSPSGRSPAAGSRHHRCVITRKRSIATGRRTRTRTGHVATDAKACRKGRASRSRPVGVGHARSPCCVGLFPCGCVRSQP